MGTLPRASILDLPLYRAGRRSSSQAPDALARLASNESPFGPLPHVAEVIAAEVGAINRYPEVRSDTLRQAIARWLEVAPASVTTGPGSSGILWNIAEALLEPGDEMVIAEPSFEAYPIIAGLMGADLVRVPLRDHAVDVGAMVAAVGERTKLMVIAEPNNPTGTSIGPEALDHLIEATAGRCILVIDEAYFEFAPAADAHRSIEMARRHTHALVLRTFSKAHGLAGLRVGYALGDPPLVEALDRVAPPFSVSSIAQVAALASIGAIDQIADRVSLVAAERDRVIGALRAIGLTVPDTATNFVWVPCAEAVWSAELDRQGIVTRCVPEAGVRITVGAPEENDRVIAAFETLLTTKEEPT